MNGIRSHDDPQNQVVFLVFNETEYLEIVDGHFTKVIGATNGSATLAATLHKIYSHCKAKSTK